MNDFIFCDGASIAYHTTGHETIVLHANSIRKELALLQGVQASIPRGEVLDCVKATLSKTIRLIDDMNLRESLEMKANET